MHVMKMTKIIIKKSHQTFLISSITQMTDHATFPSLRCCMLLKLDGEEKYLQQ